VVNIPIINSQKIQNLIENCLNKNKFSGISSKIELMNDIINFMIYILIKFVTFQNNNQQFIPNEMHILHLASKSIHESIVNTLVSSEKEIKEELDTLNGKKKEINNDSKKAKEDKEKDIANLEIRSNQLLILIENLKKLKEIKI